MTTSAAARLLGTLLRRLARTPPPPPAAPVRKRVSRRRTPQPRDTQRRKVYGWENEHVLPLDRRIMSIGACARLVEEAYRWAEADLAGKPGWHPPEVTDGRGRRHACGSRQVIKLPRWARTVPVVLHECAHGLADDRHGPRFVARYVDLLVRFMGLDRSMLLATLARHRIRIAIADGLGTPPQR